MASPPSLDGLPLLTGWLQSRRLRGRAQLARKPESAPDFLAPMHLSIGVARTGRGRHLGQAKKPPRGEGVSTSTFRWPPRALFGIRATSVSGPPLGRTSPLPPRRWNPGRRQISFPRQPQLEIEARAPHPELAETFHRTWGSKSPRPRARSRTPTRWPQRQRRRNLRGIPTDHRSRSASSPPLRDRRATSR